MAEVILENSLLDIGKDNLIEYATEVIMNRALPDYRDGLKPVHRRILWAMLELGFRHNGRYYKCARVVGDTMGKYHPHGNMAIYEALVNMAAKLPIPLIQDMGNFGNLTDTKFAADRYTECKLSKYAELTMLDSRYLAVTNKVPNYTAEYEEPIYLPALFPNLLLNGSSGIAVGVTCDIPPIHIDSLMPFVEDAINGEEFSAKQLAKKLRFNWKNGSKCISDIETIINWLKVGYGESLYFEPAYKADGDTRTLTVTEAPPFFNWDNVVEKVGGYNEKTGKKNYEFVSSIDDMCTSKDGIQLVVKFKSSINREDFMDHVKTIMKEFTNYVKTATNVTYRKTATDIKFIRLNVPDLITAWTDYRVKLEVRMQKNVITKLDEGITRQDWLLIASENIDLLGKIAKTSDKPIQDIMTKLKVIEEGAKYIFDQSLSRLAKISKDKITNDKSSLLKQKKEAISYRDKPGPKILSDMSDGMKLITG